MWIQRGLVTGVRSREKEQHARDLRRGGTQYGKELGVQQTNLLLQLYLEPSLTLVLSSGGHNSNSFLQLVLMFTLYYLCSFLLNI